MAYGSPSSTTNYCGNMIYENGALKQILIDDGYVTFSGTTPNYGARHYNPCILRFTTMDPMCEKYYHLSPYAYCGNNPVNSLKAVKEFSSNELKKNLIFWEVGITVGSPNPKSLYTKTDSFSWNLLKQPIILQR